MKITLTPPMRFAILFCGAICSGCNSQTTNPISNQTISAAFHNIKPNRPNEMYVLWAEVPKNAASGKSSPLHGANASKLISTFIVDSNGTMIGYDTSGVKARIGFDYALIIRCELSVEDAGTIGPSPTNILLAGDITGTSATGMAMLTATDGYAFGPRLAAMTSVATLASPAGSNDYKGEVYLMNAASATTATTGFQNYLFISPPWYYGLWTIDSNVSPPVNTFLGFISSPTSQDTRPAHDHFQFPGGRSPDDSTKPVLDLTKGNGIVMVTLEPSTAAGLDPTVPFAAPVLIGYVPAGEKEFSPFNLNNTVSKLPTIDIIVHR